MWLRSATEATALPWSPCCFAEAEDHSTCSNHTCCCHKRTQWCKRHRTAPDLHTLLGNSTWFRSATQATAWPWSPCCFVEAEDHSTCSNHTCCCHSGTQWCKRHCTAPDLHILLGNSMWLRSATEATALPWSPCCFAEAEDHSTCSNHTCCCHKRTQWCKRHRTAPDLHTLLGNSMWSRSATQAAQLPWCLRV